MDLEELKETNIEKFVYLDGQFWDRVSDRASWISNSESIQEAGGVIQSARFFVDGICGGSLRLDYTTIQRQVLQVNHGLHHTQRIEG